MREPRREGSGRTGAAAALRSPAGAAEVVPAPEAAAEAAASPAGAAEAAGARAGALPSLLRDAQRRLAAITETPRLDAELLAAQAFGLTREQLLLAEPPQLQAGAGEAGAERSLERFAELLDQRLRLRRPIAYIIGRRDFRRLSLLVDERALIPRPESELLVEACLALPAGSAVIDVGTGSGAIALALKDERPDLRVCGSDISARALDLAAENRGALGLDIELVQADLLAGAPAETTALVCNPPYVATGERERLEPEITRHEPELALYGGGDGLAVIRALAEGLAARPAIGFAAIEIGAGQARAAQALLRAAGFQSVRRARDLAGIERVLIATRQDWPGG